MAEARRIRTLDDFLDRFPGYKTLGNGRYLVKCPAHDDHEPSLSVTFKNRKILLFCHGGCMTEHVVAAMGLTMADLSLNGDRPEPGQRKEVAIYKYLGFEVVRYEPKDFKQRRSDGNGGYIWNLDGVVLTLYHQDELPEAIAKGTTIYHPEGEKDADRLRTIVPIATCNPGGAGKWKDSYTAALKGADLVIIPDKDKPGHDHAQKVAQACHGIAKRVRILTLPGDGKDVSDWLNSGGNAEQLKELADDCPDWTPAAKILDKKGLNLTPLLKLYQEPEEQIAYIWDDTLIKGGISIAVGKPKAGKTTFAQNLAFFIAKGVPCFLGRDINVTGPVVYLALEEKRSEVRKHFERMGADGNLPIFIHIGSAPEKAIEELRKAIIETKAVFAIVDTLQRLVRIKDLNDYATVSLALEPLMQIARETNCHILLIHHANKGVSKDAGDSILGSTAIHGSVDCALIIKRGEDYRTIESIQRYGVDLPRTVLSFDAATGLTSSGGSLEDAQVNECGKSIIEIVDGHELTEKEIKEGITDHKGGIISKSLRLLYMDGKIHRKGLGKKGDPFTYSLTSKNAGDSRDMPIQIPTIPTKTTNNISYENASIPGIPYISSITNPNPQHFDPGQPDDLPLEDDPGLEPCLIRPRKVIIELWTSMGRPVVFLAPGENCFDLELKLSNENILPRHIEAINNWFTGNGGK